MWNRTMRLSLVPFFLLGLTIAHPAFADFSKAKYQGKPFCPKGSFYDPRQGGQCWACPTGTHRTVLHPVNSSKACEKRAYSSWSKATFRGKAKRSKPKGAFYDPRKGGEWWKCPSNRPRRTAYAVTHKRACATKRIIGEKFAKAKYLGKIKRAKPKGAFYDPRKGGEYWSCPKSFKRSAFPVSAKNACHRVHPATFARASYKGKFGCAKGSFFDPRKGGECWSCPRAWHRTINPVTSTKACASKIAQVFTVESAAMCKSVINGLRSGTKGAQKLNKKLDSITAPVLRSVQRVMNQVVPPLDSPKEVDKLFDKIAVAMRRTPDVIKEVARVGTLMNQNPGRIGNILLDPVLMCQGGRNKINQSLIKAGLNPNFRSKRAGLMDGLLVKSAHAAWPTGFHIVSFSSGGRPADKPIGTAITVSIVTNFGGGKFGIFISAPTAIAATQPGLDFSVGYLYFENATWENFDGVAQLGIEVEVGLGNALKKLMGKVDNVPYWPNVAYVASGDPAFFVNPRQNPLGHGFNMNWSWDDDEGEKPLRVPDWIDLSASVDHTIKFLGN